MTDNEMLKKLASDERDPIGPTAEDIRDLFAAQAMNGWLTTYGPDFGRGELDMKTLAQWSYRMADAMLKAREP